MIIWRGAIARSGGTLLQNLSTFILERKGIKYTDITRNDVLYINELQKENDERYAALLNIYASRYWVGGHDYMYVPVFSSQPFRILFSRRDPRACLASAGRFTQESLQDWKHSLSNFMAIYERMEALPDQLCLKLSYKDDILNIPQLTHRIAAFLDLSVTETDIDMACERFTRSAVRTRMDALTQKLIRLIENSNAQADEPIIRIFLRSTENSPEHKKIKIPTRYIKNYNEIKLEKKTNKLTLSEDVFGMKADLILNKDGNTWRFKFHDFQQNHVSNSDDPDAWRQQIPESLAKEWADFCRPFLLKYGYTP